MRDKVLGKAFLVLEELTEADSPLTLKELSLRLGMNASTLSRIANDLVEGGYLRKASYRSFEPALGLIHLGQRALLNCQFPKKVSRLVCARCRATGLKGALAGVFKDRLVYLYNSSHEGSGRSAGMPFSYLTHKSNIALAVLARRHGRKEALRILKGSLKRSGQEASEELLRSFASRMDQLESEGCSFLDGEDFWNVAAPVEWQGEVYGLSLFGSKGSRGSERGLVKETLSLAASVREALLNCEAEAP